MENQKLRIFVVLPMYGGSLPIGRYCIRAFEEMGHTVGVFEAPVLYDSYLALKRLDLAPEHIAQVEEMFLQLVTQTIWMQINSFHPDFVFAVAQAPLGKSILTNFKQANIKTVMWFVEDYRLFTYWKVLAPLYDVFAIIQKEPFISELEKIGQPNVLYLPLAAQPGIHENILLSEKEKKEYGSEIGFLGAGYPNRRIAFRGLADKDFKIWGSDWNEEKILKKNIQRNGERISEEESVKIYNATTININLHSSVQTENLVSGGDFVNPRTFELAAIGAFQLVDKRSLMPELFNEDELATFDSITDFYNKIDYYLKHDDERNKIISKSKNRVLKDHTYYNRMTRVINFIEEKFGNFDQKRDKNKFSDIENPLKDELITLMHKLDINYDEVSFNDVLISLRKNKGRLNEVEMSLLFLDEFKKQYNT